MQSSFWKSRTFRFWVVCYVIILLVPIAAGVALYRYTTDTLTHKAYENGRMNVRQVSTVVDEQLKTVSNIGNTIYVSSTLAKMKYITLPFTAKKYYETHARAKYLANFTTQQALIKYIYAYCGDLECLLDSGHIYTRDNQLNKVITQRIGLSEDDFLALMSQNHLRDFYVLDGGKSLIMVQTLGARGDQPVVTLIIVLNADSIHNLLMRTSETTNGSAYMLLPDGSVFGDRAVGDPADYAALSTQYEEGQGTSDGLVVTYADSIVTPFRFVLSVPSATFLKDITDMSYALDKATIVSTVYGDYAFATDDIFPVNHWSHSTTVTTYPYDPAKAKALLEEAGYVMNDATGIYEKDGEPLHLIFDMVTKGQSQADMAQLIQQYFKAVGIDMEIREQDFSTLAFTRLLPQDANGVSRAVTADDFDMYTLGFGVEVDPDEYRNYFVSTATPPNGMNFISYSNAKVDELFTKSLSLTTLEDREACYHEIADTISNDIPWIPLYGNLSITGVSNKVQGFAADFRGITYQIEKWTIQ